MPRSFDPQRYGPLAAGLIGEIRPPSLGRGQPTAGFRERLVRVSIGELFAPAPVRDQDMGRACLRALWLWHNYLDESHTLSQSIQTPAGSYWHGIMHRREGDFGNSGYWFRKVGRFSTFEALAAAAGEILATQPGATTARRLISKQTWDPFAFIDLCESCVNTPGADQQVAREVALVEWHLLFDHCWAQAIGAAS